MGLEGYSCSDILIQFCGFVFLACLVFCIHMEATEIDSNLEVEVEFLWLDKCVRVQ